MRHVPDHAIGGLSLVRRRRPEPAGLRRPLSCSSGQCGAAGCPCSVVAARVETMIETNLQEALAALDVAEMTTAGREALTLLAHAAVTRSN